MMISFLKKLIVWGGICFVLVLTLAVGYCWYLSGRIEDRFSGRRWDIPSTIYADSTLLFPGKPLSLSRFEEKLRKLGYRRTSGPPGIKGEYRVEDSDMEIYFRDLDLPDNHRPGFPAILSMADGKIRLIRRTDTGGALPLVELAPEVLMEFFGRERELRRVVSMGAIPAHLRQSVMAAEDHRFYDHFGVDPRGILRALYTNIRYGEIRQGGSTLTQQLAKNYFLTPERTFRRKLHELFIALTLEFNYTKDEILEIYLNEIYLGQKGSAAINGVGEAAYFYFGKPVENLTLAESGAIAGLIKGPNLFSPYTHPENCKSRRNQVLHAMHDLGWITDDQLSVALKEPLNTVGFEKYSRKAPYFMDYVTQQLDDLYAEDILASMGFSIYTTLDTGIQAAAENAFANGLARLTAENPALQRDNPEKRLQGAVVALHPRTGNILAMVGGRDYVTSQFNRITQARRQPGSCFKPIAVAALLDTFRPSDLLSNTETTYTIDDRQWTPENFGEFPEETLSVCQMLKRSCNRAAVDMVVRGGPGKVVTLAEKFGFSTPMQPYPSIALGAFEVIPLELARAYCAFAADGIEPFPLSVKDVVDEAGNVLVQRHMDINRVLSPAKAFLVTDMLTSVVTDGTAQSLGEKGVVFPLAGKTGTTNDYRDAWFIGYTPDFLALIWVGFDNGDPVWSTGSGAALPIFAELVKSIPGHIAGKSFTMPPGVIKKKVCKQSGELAIFLQCPETYDEYFIEDNPPGRKCHIHGQTGMFRRMLDGVKDLFK
ncbi:MAG: PBP1A family penicillin-binding protein [Thermodesulfobacteriota bacterium]|nr:PBP1A family penicillin-binding protein [Thermodesulfobacteriota bacterium]